MRGGFLLIMVLIGAGVFIEAYLLIRPAMHVLLISTLAVGLFVACLDAQHRPSMAWRAYLIAVGMPVLAWSFTNVWLLLIVLGICVPLVARRFEMIVPVYLFSLLLLPGLDSAVVIGPLKLVDFSVHDALAIGAGGAIFLNRRKARPPIHLDLGAIAIILLLGVSLARETSFSNHLRQSLNVLIDLGLAYYIVSRGIRTMEDMRATMLWIACGAVTLAALLIYELWKSWPIYNSLYTQYHLPTLLFVKARGGFLRAGGPFTEPTSAAMVLAICVLSLWLCRAYFRTAWHHLLLLAVAMIGLFAPQSRGAWIGLILAVVISELFRGRYLSLTKKALVVGSAVSILLFAARASPHLSESLGLSGEASSTSDYRRMLFDKGMDAFWDHPIFGYSAPELLVRLVDLRQGEGIIDFVNTYIWIMLISGAVGLVIYLGAFLFYMASVWSVRSRILGTHDAREVATFIFASLGMILEMLFFTSFGTRPAVFVFIIFGLATAFMQINRAGAPASMADEAVSGDPSEAAARLAA